MEALAMYVTRSYCRRATGARSSLVQCHGKGTGESLHSASIHNQAIVWRCHLARQIQQSSAALDTWIKDQSIG